jgi:biotin carboxylase
MTDLSAGHLLILGGGQDLPDRARAARPGLRTTVICRSEVLPKLRSREKIQRLIVLRADAPTAEWIEAARFVHAVDPIDRIANYTEKEADKTAAIAAELGLDWHSPSTVRAVSDKVEMRGVLAAAGVDDTMAFVVRDAQEVRTAAERTGYPLILKPVRGVASQGVARIDGPEEVESALIWSSDGSQGLDDQHLLVEPFHVGDEYSVECLSEDGEHLVVGVTAKFSDHEHFVELGHVLPAPLEAADVKRVIAVVHGMLDALGVRHGVTHTEVIVQPEAVRVVETHLRPAGDEIPEMWAHITGVDLLDLLARQSVGQRVLAEARATLDRAQPRCAAIWYACPDAAGELLAVNGLDEAKAVDGVVEVEAHLAPGSRLGRVTGSFARAAHVWAEGEDQDQALRRARDGVRQLSFTVKAAG